LITTNAKKNTKRPTLNIYPA